MSIAQELKPARRSGGTSGPGKVARRSLFVRIHPDLWREFADEADAALLKKNAHATLILAQRYGRQDVADGEPEQLPRFTVESKNGRMDLNVTVPVELWDLFTEEASQEPRHSQSELMTDILVARYLPQWLAASDRTVLARVFGTDHVTDFLAERDRRHPDQEDVVVYTKSA